MLGKTQRVSAPTALPRAMESACGRAGRRVPDAWAPPCKPRCGDTRGRQREAPGGLNRGSRSLALSEGYVPTRPHKGGRHPDRRAGCAATHTRCPARSAHTAGRGCDRAQRGGQAGGGKGEGAARTRLPFRPVAAGGAAGGSTRWDAGQADIREGALTLLALGGGLDVHLAVQQALPALQDGLGSALHLRGERGRQE